jgi:DNA-binding response OmpR family regulator
VKLAKTDPRKRVLIIDDDIDILTVLEILLTMEGFKIDTSCTSNALHERIDSFKPNLILLNTSVGHEKGIDICKDIKKKNHGHNIKIILLSHDPEEKQPALKHGDGFLKKPVEMKPLLKKISSLLK